MTLPLLRQKPRLGHLLALLPSKYQWSLHNLVGHPVSEVFHILGWDRASEWAHASTAPQEGEESHGW